MSEPQDAAVILIQQVLFETEDSQGRPVISRRSRAVQIAQTLRQFRLLSPRETVPGAHSSGQAQPSPADSPEDL